MLTVDFISDKEVLLPLYKKVGINGGVEGVNLVLFDDGEAIGLCRLFIGEEVVLKDFLTLTEDFSIKDFFFRTVLFKLSFNPYILKVETVDERLKRFGFVENNGTMILDTAKVIFPSDCH